MKIGRRIQVTKGSGMDTIVLNGCRGWFRLIQADGDIDLCNTRTGAAPTNKIYLMLIRSRGDSVLVLSGAIFPER